MTSDLDLQSRAGLPKALRVLVAEYPRTGWQQHPNFNGMVQFLLERHLMFRKLVHALETDHAVMGDLLQGMAEVANAVLGGGEVGVFSAELDAFGALLARNLVDEEELIVPVILASGFAG